MHPTYILTGPQGIGKTTAARQIASILGCSHVVDEWDGVATLPAGALALTNALGYNPPRGAVVFSVMDAEGISNLLDTLSSHRDTEEQPARIFRLPYAVDFYVCTCGAAVRPDCTCSQELTLGMAANRHLRDPEVVAWLTRQSQPFTASDAAAALGGTADPGDIRLWQMVRLRSELAKCGCTYDEDTKRFTPPPVDTLRRLRLRRPECSQSRHEESQPCQPVPFPHPEPSQAPHADRQSDPADLQASCDQQSPQKSA